MTTTYYEERPGLVLQKFEILRTIRRELSGHLSLAPFVAYSDPDGHGITHERVEAVLARSRVDRDRWIESKHDCENFAWRLVADFHADAMDDPEMTTGHIVGMVWGEFDGAPHALVWFIGADCRLWLIEPQTDEVFMIRESDRGIWMVIG
jgi:hypothetical protein